MKELVIDLKFKNVKEGTFLKISRKITVPDEVFVFVENSVLNKDYELKISNYEKSISVSKDTETKG